MRKWTPLKKHPNIYEYETAKGKRYGIRRGFKNSENKRDEFTKSGFKNWKDAQIVLTDFENKLNTGELGPVSNRSLTLDECFNLMVDFKIKQNLWKKSTLSGILSYYKNHIKNKFGDKKIADIKRIEYEGFINDLINSGLRKLTIKTINSLMQSIMNYAEIHDLIRKNVLTHIMINGGKESKDQSLSKEDFDIWMQAAEEHLSEYKYAILKMSTLGERRSELIGLRYKDVTFFEDNGIKFCKISWNVGRTNYEQNGGTLKNKNSYRTNYISGDILKYFHIVINYSQQMYAKNNEELTDESFIIVTERDGKVVNPAYINKIFDSVNIQKQPILNGIKLNPHKFRHYFATQALTNPNIPDIDVMHWLGHKNLQMTADYTRDNKTSSTRLYEQLEHDFEIIHGTNNGTEKSTVNGTKINTD